MYNHMVVHKKNDQKADKLFNALSDTTRRSIVTRCLQGDHTVSELARSYPMSFAAVQKHVAVLERAELVTKHRTRKRTVWCQATCRAFAAPSTCRTVRGIVARPDRTNGPNTYPTIQSKERQNDGYRCFEGLRSEDSDLLR